MKNTKSGLFDSDKAFITIALWICAVALFATALTLPMLPEQVTIFYKTNDMDAEYYSKYNNLIIIFVSIIPAGIIGAAAMLRKHNKMQHNFPSILLFSIMLSVCMSGVAIYGLSRQFISTSSIKDVDVKNIIAILICALLSIGSSVLPAIFRSPAMVAKASDRSVTKAFFIDTLDRYWGVGALGFLAAAVVCAFVIGVYTFIPLAVGFVLYLVFLVVMTHAHIKHSVETAVYDALEE